jgi:hypothetical protein
LVLTSQDLHFQYISLLLTENALPVPRFANPIEYSWISFPKVAIPVRG